jgi:hypothetical protein
MIEYEAFAGSAPALTLYACALPPEQGFALLRRQLEDGSWRQEPGTWFRYARSVCFGIAKGRSPELVALQTELARQLMAAPIGPEAHAVLPLLFDLNSFDPQAPELAALRDWLVDHGGPGEASLVADILTHGILHRTSSKDAPEARALLQPLTEWLLRNGAAELRSKRRVELVIQMAVTCHEIGADPAITLAALRYLLVNEGRMPWGRVSSTGDFFRSPLLGTIEAALAFPGGGAYGAALARTADIPEARWLVQQFLHGEPDLLPFPGLREVLVRGLFRGQIEPPRTNAVSELWSAALAGPYPGDEVATFATADALESALQALRCFPEFGPRRSRHTPDARERRRWGRRLATEAIRVWGLAGVANHSDVNAPRLNWAIGFGDDASFDLGVRDGLEAALAARDADSPSLALRILREHPDERRALFSAFRALAPHSERRVTASPAPHVLSSIRERLLSLLHAPWFEPEAGVNLSSLLKGAREITFQKLSHENKVFIDETSLQVDDAALMEALDTAMSDEEQIALGLIYVVHELVHVQQGIAAKARVVDLRATGAETTLLHLDLSADHATALIVAKATPKWTPLWLKDLQGRSLVRFPAGPLHTSASRARKAQRHVALRLDYLLRKSHPERETRLGGGYAFADFGPAGGRFLVLGSGPPSRLVGSAPLDAKEAALLEQGVSVPEGAGPTTDPREVDALLTRLLGALDG